MYVIKFILSVCACWLVQYAPLALFMLCALCTPYPMPHAPCAKQFYCSERAMAAAISASSSLSGPCAAAETAAAAAAAAGGDSCSSVLVPAPASAAFLAISCRNSSFLLSTQACRGGWVKRKRRRERGGGRDQYRVTPTPTPTPTHPHPHTSIWALSSGCGVTSAMVRGARLKGSIGSLSS